MKTLLVNTDDGRGGASTAVRRLLDGLTSTGAAARLVTLNKQTDDPRVLCVQPRRISCELGGWRKIVDLQPLYTLHPRRRRVPFSLHWLPERTYRKINRWSPDIVHLHWVSAGFLRIESLSRIKAPMVWTLHDMWPFTGGCHYSGTCENYTGRCGACPILGSRRVRDMSRWVWRRKKRSWAGLNLTLVSPSRWLAARAEQSGLLGRSAIHVIPNGLDTLRFSPMPQQAARDILKIPGQGRVVLFGCADGIGDRRKGLKRLFEALEIYRHHPEAEPMEVVVFGASRLPGELRPVFPVRCLGYLGDDTTLALAYSAADLFVAPAQEDNLPNTVMEAMSCGTPVLAFDIGGMPDMIDHKKNGYLADPRQAGSLVRGLDWLAGGGPGRLPRLAEDARRKACKAFDQRVQAERYSRLYREILLKKRA